MKEFNCFATWSEIFSGSVFLYSFTAITWYLRSAMLYSFTPVTSWRYDRPDGFIVGEATQVDVSDPLSKGVLRNLLSKVVHVPMRLDYLMFNISEVWYYLSNPENYFKREVYHACLFLGLFLCDWCFLVTLMPAGTAWNIFCWVISLVACEFLRVIFYVMTILNGELLMVPIDIDIPWRIVTVPISWKK